MCGGEGWGIKPLCVCWGGGGHQAQELESTNVTIREMIPVSGP